MLNTQARVRVCGGSEQWLLGVGHHQRSAIVPASVTPALGDYVTSRPGSATAQFAFNGATLTSPAQDPGGRQ